MSVFSNVMNVIMSCLMLGPHSEAASPGAESGTILVSPLVVRGQGSAADRMSGEEYKYCFIVDLSEEMYIKHNCCLTRKDVSILLLSTLFSISIRINGSLRRQSRLLPPVWILESQKKIFQNFHDVFAAYCFTILHFQRQRMK